MSTFRGRKIFEKKLRKAFLRGALLFGVFALFGMLAITIALAWISRNLPDPNTLMTREIPLTTKLYDRTGEHLLYEIHGEENRTLVQLRDLPAYVAGATIAVEDKHFYRHRGVDWLGLVRAVVKSALVRQRVKGTSTLTQQFVKNAVLTNERSVARKLKELLLAIQLERVYTKDQILQLYLNEIPYGSTIYGIESAARNYFGKAAKELTLDEAALLAALPQAPDLYSPYGTGVRGDNRSRLVARQRYILTLMAEQGKISQAQAEDAIKLNTLKKLVPKNLGVISAPHFVMYVRSLLTDLYGHKMVEEKGLKILTTLDWEKQRIAEEEVQKGVEARGASYRFTNASLVSIDPKTGQILAMVGSKNFFDAAHDGQVNVALRPRQPGSSFKPIVYAAGFSKGYTPETTLWDVHTVFKTEIKNYEPKNYDLKEHGPVSIRQALQGSLNIPAVKTIYLVGVDRVLDFAESLGYSTLGTRSRFGLSLVLGGGEVKLLEHTQAYATFANDGRQFPTAAILRVEDAAGNILEEWKSRDGAQVIDREVTRTLSQILSDNEARAFVFGIKNYLTLPGRPVAAKTGTTNNFHDAWALGYTPSLAAGVWVGNNDNAEMRRGADGSQIAAPIWQGYMRRALEKTRVEAFPQPHPTPQALSPVLLGRAAETKIPIDTVSRKRATSLTPPETTEEMTVREAHTILHYLDKDDPRGPAPEDPTHDPQYLGWESAIQQWVIKTGWLSSTSTPPTEFDDVHTSSSLPLVTITSPTPLGEYQDRSGFVSAEVSSPRRIIRLEVWSGGHLLGATFAEPWTSIPIQFPSSLERGFHELEVIAVDEVGNRGRSTLTINLNAAAPQNAVSIIKPASGSRIRLAEFPLPILINAQETTPIYRVDLYAQTIPGSVALITSLLSPTSSPIVLTIPAPARRAPLLVFPVITTKTAETLRGEKITIMVE